jgi:hypothetical protein
VSGDNTILPRLEETETALHEKQLDVLTRLRLLASQEIIAAAESLHFADHALIDAAHLVRRGDDLDGGYKDSRAINKKAKTDMLDAVRKSLKLQGSARIHPDM